MTQEQLHEWTDRLGSDDPKVREKARGILEKAGPAALPFLEEKSQSGDPEVRSICKLLIDRVEREKVNARFLKKFPDSEPVLKWNADFATVYFSGDPKVKRGMIEEFKSWILDAYSGSGDFLEFSNNVEKQVFSLEHLPQAAAPVLVDLFSSPDDATRRTAFQAFKKMWGAVGTYSSLLKGSPDVDSFSKCAPDLLRIWENWPGTGKIKKEAWLSGGWDPHRWILSALTQLQPDGLSDALIERVRSEKTTDSRDLVYWAIGKLNVTEAGPFLVRRLEKGEFSEELIWAVIQLEEKRAMTVLEKGLKNRTPVTPGGDIDAGRADEKNINRKVNVTIQGTRIDDNAEYVTPLMCDRVLEALIRLSGEKISEYGGTSVSAGTLVKSVLGVDLENAPIMHFSLRFQSEEQRGKAIERWKVKNE